MNQALFDRAQSLKGHGSGGIHPTLSAEVPQSAAALFRGGVVLGVAEFNGQFLQSKTGQGQEDYEPGQA